MIEQLAKITLTIGIVIVFIGAVLWLFSKLPFVGKLPGDIYIKRGSWSFYAPITTMVIISLMVSLLLTVITYFKK